MQSKLLSASALVLLSSSLVAAQTSSACNPVKGDKCKDDPAFGGTFEIDFTKGASDLFTEADGTSLTYDKSLGAVFTMKSEKDAPTITSTKYMFFGSVEVVCQAAVGTGIVTSFVLQSDDLDEIDWEWLGGDDTQVQTNYFSKGDTTTYDRGGFSTVSNPQTTFHTYKIDWTTESVVWSIDGTTVRTLTAASAGNGASFPQTPMQVKLGTWDGGSSTAAKGTVEWAGGLTPWGNGNGPYTGYYKSLKIVDKSNGVSGATSYTYGDTSGSYSSIKVNTGGSSSSNETESSSSSSSASASATKSAGSSSATGKTTATESSAAESSSAAASTTKGSSNGTATGASGSASATATGTGSAGKAGSDKAGSSNNASTTLATASATNGGFSTGSATASGTAATSAVVTAGAGKVAAGVFGVFGAAVMALIAM